MHLHESILPQNPLPSRLPHDTEQSSVCSSGEGLFVGGMKTEESRELVPLSLVHVMLIV